MRLVLSTIFWTVLPLLFAACSPTSPSAAKPETAALNASNSAAQHIVQGESRQARTSRLWAQSCALCHVDGNGGAPRLGYPAEWEPRLQQDRQQLLRNTINGLNNMPPLGYCMACERDDFLAMIDLMTATVATPEVAGDAQDES